MIVPAAEHLRDIYLPASASVTGTQPMTASERFMRIQVDDGNGASYRPGQFMEITVPCVGEAPISISSSPTRVNHGAFEMVVRNVGNVTDALHRMETGGRLGVRGPFGTAFPVDEAMKGRDLLFVCGGIGLVPVRSAIHYVLDRRSDYGAVTVLFGARRPTDRLFVEELYDLKMREDVDFIETVGAADPARGGNVGVITTLFRRIRIRPEQTVAVVCGPPIMYKFVLLELQKVNLPHDQVYVSLERHMKCGVGKCGHCQINGLYACQSGPVFRYADIQTVKEAI
jgi:NAD(P)H-flavin reductase